MSEKEILDIYNEKAEKTGRVIVRGTPVRQGEYSMCVHIYIYNSSGQFLLQKRSKQKRSLPGIWSITCGAVSSGEESKEAALREANEELGLEIPDEDMIFISRIKSRRSFIDIYFAHVDFEMSDLILQEEEVDDIRLCDGKELLNIVSSSERVNNTYSAAVLRAMRKRNLI